MRVVIFWIAAVHVFAAASMLASCSTWETKPVPCPVRPILESFTPEELSGMDFETMEKMGINQIRLKEYAKKLEIRAGCEGR